MNRIFVFLSLYLLSSIDIPKVFSSSYAAWEIIPDPPPLRASQEQQNLLGTTADNKPITRENLKELIAAKKLKKANFYEANLKWLNLKGANLEGANFEGAYLLGAILDGASFRKANLPEAEFFETGLRSINFRYANLTKADFRYVKLRETDLTGANLSNAKFIGADLMGAVFRGANLSNAHLTDADLWGADLRGANLSLENLDGLNLAGVIMYAQQALRLGLNIKKEGIMTPERIEMFCLGYYRENISGPPIPGVAKLIVSFYYEKTQDQTQKTDVKALSGAHH